jgi:hypothetical protein
MGTTFKLWATYMDEVALLIRHLRATRIEIVEASAPPFTGRLEVTIEDPRSPDQQRKALDLEGLREVCRGLKGAGKEMLQTVQPIGSYTGNRDVTVK